VPGNIPRPSARVAPSKSKAALCCIVCALFGTRTLAWPLVVAVTSCSTAITGPTTAPRRLSFERARSVDAPPAEGRSFGAQWIPVLAEPIVLGDEDGALCAGVGSVRATIRGESVSIARDRPLARIVGAARDGARWLFVTSDGTAFEAASCTGALRAIARRGLFVPSVGGSRGALAWRDQLGRSWFTNGSEIRRWPLQPVESVAFIDRDTGLAITNGGVVRWTADGGRNDRIVSIGAAAALSVNGSSGAFVLQTSDGFFRLDSQGRLERASPAIEPALSISQTESLYRAIYRRWPRALFSTATSYRPFGSDALVQVGRSLLWFDPVDGALLRRNADALPTARCTATQWGRRAVFDCVNSMGVLLWDPAQPLRPFAPIRSLHSLLLSDDGASALSLGACRSDAIASRDRVRPEFCARAASRGWFSVPSSLDRRLPIALRHETALVARSGDELPLALYSLNTGTYQSLPAPADFSEFELRHQVGSIASDGTAWVYLAGDDSSPTPRESALALWRDGRVSRTPLPLETVSVGVMDARHIVVAGRTSNDVWLSSDGGQRFERTPLRAARGGVVAFDANTSPTVAVACRADGCLLNEMVFVGSHQPVEDEVVFASNAADIEPPIRSASFVEPLGLQCRRDERPRPIDATRARWQTAPFGRYLIEARSGPGPREVALSISWALEGRSRATPAVFSASNPALDLAAVSDTTLLGAAQGWTLVLANERFALAERCLPGFDWGHCERFIARVGASIERVLSPHAVGRTVATIDGPAGTTVALANRGGAPLRMAWLFDSAGRTRAQRAIPSVSQLYFTQALARRGARVGVLAVHDVLGVSRWEFVPLFEGESLALASSEVFSISGWQSDRICGARAAPAHWTIVDQSRTLPVGLSIGFRGEMFDTTRLTLEVSDSGEACLRAAQWQDANGYIDPQTEDSRDSLLGGISAMGVEGPAPIRGVARTARSVIPVRCEADL